MGDLSYGINSDGSITFKDYAIDASDYWNMCQVNSISNEFRELQLRVEVLENKLKEKKAQSAKEFVIVYGE